MNNTKEIIVRYAAEITPTTTNKTMKSGRASKETRYANFEIHKDTSLEEKERYSIELLKMAFKRSKNPVISCSFGIDSILCIHLAKRALEELGRDIKEIDIVWNDTLNEFPEVRKYAKEITEKWNLNLKVYKPEKPLKKIIEDNGGVDSSYFTARKGKRDKSKGKPLSEKCCGTLKHKPMKKAIKENGWDLVINGLRGDESVQRKLAGLRDGEYFYSISEWKSFVCRPILWIREHEVWEYVKKHNVPYNDLYNKHSILSYPDNDYYLRTMYENELLELGIDNETFSKNKFNSWQAAYLKSIGYKDIFTMRTGCMMCPIPIKYGYLQVMRNQYPKVYNAMIHNLGYGKGLLELIPDDVKKEIKALTGIDMNEEEAEKHLKEILEAKPCTFDKFN